MAPEELAAALVDLHVGDVIKVTTRQHDLTAFLTLQVCVTSGWIMEADDATAEKFGRLAVDASGMDSATRTLRFHVLTIFPPDAFAKIMASHLEAAEVQHQQDD